MFNTVNNDSSAHQLAGGCQSVISEDHFVFHVWQEAICTICTDPVFVGCTEAGEGIGTISIRLGIGYKNRRAINDFIEADIQSGQRDFLRILNTVFISIDPGIVTNLMDFHRHLYQRNHHCFVHYTA